jgi:hypothetical protein
MFNGCGFHDMEGDFVDISFRNTEKNWVVMTPKGSIKFTNFEMGDPVSGPNVLLGYEHSKMGELVDWTKFDPLHSHGSDHFRAVTAAPENAGSQLIGNGIKIHKITPGTFSFQEAGVIYREIPEKNSNVWLLHFVADRRGNRGIIKWESDRETLAYSGNPNDIPLADDETYPDGLGRTGIPAISTTLGPVDSDGYLHGVFADLSARKKANAKHAVEKAFLGDRITGPVILLIKSDPNSVLSPPSQCGTERLLCVIKGSCRVGEAAYQAGDLRVQRMESTMPEIRVGKDGMEAVIIVGDRRKPVEVSAPDDAAIDWTWDAGRPFS